MTYFNLKLLIEVCNIVQNLSLSVKITDAIFQSGLYRGYAIVLPNSANSPYT